MLERLKRGHGGLLVVLQIIFLSQLIRNATGETLTPPYFNLAEGKNITATATCGVDTEGPELYCKLIGANSDKDLDVNVILGQYCDYCDPTKLEKSHPPEYAVDGMETWWQSPPLSRGMKYNEVNLTIDLGQEFHVAYIYIKMANSPRPGLWVLEKSADYGKTYTPWQYFSDSPADCEKFFGKETLQPITRDDSVICTTEYSKIVPLEGGEIPISLLQKRPSAKHYFNSTVLQEWTRATNVRLRFLRTKNLLGHLMSVARQDPTVTRRYFYSIKDISIGGRCMCNGHAQTCDIPDPRDNKVLLCRCSHNTCGAKCDSCCPGFEQKAWRQSKHDNPFSCEPCNCFNHSNECIYNATVDKEHRSLDIHGKYEGGGVCQNCQHNTEGINCNKCKPKFFRPYNKVWNETDVCQACQCDNFYSTGNCAEGSGRCECRKEFTPPNCDKCSFGHYDYPNCKACECFLNGTLNLQCSSKDGQCTCLPNFGGQFCKECAPGYYKFPECVPCECDINGADSPACSQESGNCSCKVNYSGKKCGECKDGYYDYPACNYCNCDLSGTKEGICDKSNGQCMCKEGYSGDRCDQCVLGYFGYPNCEPCNCSKVGSHGSTCSAAGKCSCLVNYAGRTCEQCSPGYYNYPDCKPCDCNSHGANGVSCDNEGTCECYNNFAGQQCDMCKEGYYNFPDCEDCNCNPAGVIAGFAGCGSVPAGELCQCKDRVEGRICDKCKPLFWNLHSNNPEGCEECNCNKSGVLGGIQVCDNENGQCVCKPSVIARGCSECADGTYNLNEDNLFGCTDCGCDVGGSVNNICDKKTGQCICQSRVTGRTCKQPLQAHYFPTLYQYQYEVEDGRTPENSRVRYANDEEVFPDYSWKGYAVFSVLQKDVVKDIFIYKPSLYRMVFRFINRNPYTVIGGIRITPDNPNDIEQYLKVQFRNTSEPSFITVSGESGNTPSPFVMNPGRWSISINVNESVFLDYFVLLPEDFYLATVLNQNVEKPCTLDDQDLCRHYAYPNITFFDKTFGVGGYITQNNGKKIEPAKEYYPNTDHLTKAGVLNRVPLLNSNQPEIKFNITLYKSGSYVIIVNYITPIDDLRTHRINVITSNNEQGSVILYSCPYTTMCRQVVTNQQDGVAVYEVGSNALTISLKGDDPNVGIHSVYAIPYEEWSLDFIKPKPVCIRKNGTCVESTFRNPPETKKIQFERELEGELSKNKPPVTERNDKKYVWLNPSEKSIDIRGKVPTPGYYTFVLQYYQPDYPDFDLNVIIQNGQFYEAKIPMQYCPTLSGCRSVVVQNDRNNKFSLTENFMITLTQPDNKNVYLDYILVIPADLYDERNLEQEQLDRTLEFIATCGSNHLNIDTSQEGFCRDSVFSITANHNSGALPCQCDFYGSQSFECEKFGGQCQCKENIIGRQCTACKPGYYGFPECKKCNCPSTATCEPSTGQCICPPHVVGENCDQCEPLTFGYDSNNGCEECKCNYLGVNGTRQCDLLSGACPCKENIVGRPCDVCKAGYYLFPYCESCDCDLKGTVPEICDQNTAECFCKKNVVGPQCNFCNEGSFNLQENNEEGCTECFCFGKTTRCTSAPLINSPLIEMSDWEVVSISPIGGKLNVATLNLTIENVGSDNTIGVDFSEFNLNETTAYFKAPHDYLGKKLTSYGGYLNYSIYYVTGRTGSAISGADVILEGANTYLKYASFEQPPSATDYLASLQLVESNFETSAGVPAKREHIMDVLKNLKGIYLRASYWTASVTTRLTNVIQDEGTQLSDDSTSFSNDVFIPLMSSVEQCQCPPNYQGLSCEECAPGYYRIPSGPHGGFCVPCQCNGHAAECDVNTGVCFNCTHNTRGDHCEQCDVGYHGNALAGTPMDCLICACPLPIASNNFATGCEVSSDGEKISCDCKEGYFGGRCQGCAAGFYGRPEVPHDYCKPCQCSGNINSNDPSSCDTTSGKCLKCLNNTFGEACSLCAPGFYGDAIELKDCQACICDELGTDHCDSFTGKCVCKPNVIGEKCDRCELEHYGFQSGQGCVPCDCAEASDSTQCEDATGQCKCRPGVTGRACDRCQGGYWNLTSEGCVSCGCKSDYSLGLGCNALTGQCECLKDVIGEKCNQCPHRWAFVQDYGCIQCDSCVHPLLDDTDSLAALIDPIIIEFDSTQSGYFTRRRLENMREQLDKLMPKFDEVDPKLVSLEDPIKELESIEQDSKNLNRKSVYSLENSESLRNQSIKLKDRAEVLLDELELAEEESIRVIDEIDKITGELNEEAGHEVDKALQEGQSLLDAINVYKLEGREDDAVNQLKRVNELWKNVTDYKAPVDNLKTEVDEIKTSIKTFNDKLEDLYNHTQYSLNVGKDAEKIIAKSGKDKLKSKLTNIEKQIEQSKGHLEDSEALLSNASDLLDASIGKLKQLQSSPKELESRNKQFGSNLDTNKEEIEQIRELKPKVQQHASDLSEKVQKLEHILSESQFGSNDAIKAARAYKDIVEAVNSAKAAAEAAQNDTDHAVDILTNVQDRTFDSDAISSRVLDDAFKLRQTASDSLEPRLNKAIADYQPVQAKHLKNDDVLKEIEKILNNIKFTPLDKAYRNASAMADTARTYTIEVDDLVNTSFTSLPEETQKAKALPKDLDDMGRNLIQTEKQLATVNEKLPSVIESLDQLPEIQREHREVSEKIKKSINKINQQIELARDIANNIKIGEKFSPSTTLELRNPSNIEDLTTSTKISGYFKTPKQNGLLFYLGNPNGTNLRKTHTDDYMALIVQNGYPVLKLDIGNGPEQLINEKYVANDTWYQFIIERIGHNAKLTIREELEGGKENLVTAEKSLSGPYTIFNLDKEKSKIFVGGFPPQYEMQKEIDVTSFEGEVEELVIGNNPVSLWNFNNGYENNQGAVERDKLVVLQPSTGFRFNGHGYVIVDARSLQLRSKSTVQLSFKTFATEGLIFLAGRENTFVALELRNGKVLYQYNLGSGTKKFASTNRYNDGAWHKVTAIREGARGKLTIDDENVIDRTTPVTGVSLEAIETVSFGGYPHDHNFRDVTGLKFDGCINNVTITGEPIDLRNNLKAYNVTPGCPARFAPMVSFNKTRPGYVGWDRLSIDNNFQISLKFRTKENQGLIFYATDADQSNGISLALANGYLKVISQKMELQSSDTFNDSEWHVVSVIHNDKMLRVDFDDYGYKVTDGAPPPIHTLYSTLYVGGLPRKVRPLTGTVGSEQPFHGCITDLTVNGNVKNFANTTDRSNEILDKCILNVGYEPTDPSVHVLPELTPYPELALPTTTLPPLPETDSPWATIPPGRGDGGADSARNDTVTEQPEKPVTEIVVKPTVLPEVREPGRGMFLTTTPKPVPKDGCALPLSPEPEDLKYHGYRFGAQKVSRLEYSTSRGKMKKTFDFSLEFKTDESEGILFYVSDAKTHKYYAALYLSDGYLVYTFKGDNEPLVIKSQLTYNDNQWHYVQFSRDGSNGKLVIDHKDIQGRLPQKTPIIDLHTPFYIGGLSPDDYNFVQANLNTTVPFKGCLRNFNMNSKPMESPKEFGVIPCSDNVEVGTFFGGGLNTYIKLKDRFKVGTMFNIKMSIKPRVDSGLLIAVHGRKDYLILEMVDGVLKLTAENGEGPMTASFLPPQKNKFYLCDGQWHEIQAVKSKNVVTLSVDNFFTDPKVGDYHATSTDTGSALFLGGHRLLKRVRGITARTPFVGCIKDVAINSEPVDLHTTMVEGNITVGTCRTN